MKKKQVERLSGNLVNALSFYSYLELEKLSHYPYAVPLFGLEVGCTSETSYALNCNFCPVHKYRLV